MTANALFMLCAGLVVLLAATGIVPPMNFGRITLITFGILMQAGCAGLWKLLGRKRVGDGNKHRKCRTTRSFAYGSTNATPSRLAAGAWGR